MCGSKTDVGVRAEFEALAAEAAAVVVGLVDQMAQIELAGEIGRAHV